MAEMVSVIIPVFNVEKYLEQCLDSVFQQTYDCYEVICVNDCTEDMSGEILDEYSKKYDNMKIINNESNKGLSSSRNVGLAVARGKYVLFVDSDDWIENSALEKLVDIAEKNETDIVYFNKRVVHEENVKKTRYESFIYNNNLGCVKGKEMFVQFMSDNTFKSINAYTQFFSRDFLISNRLRFYDGLVHEDYLFFFECAMRAGRTVNINDCLYVYRIRTGSITSNPRSINVNSMYMVIYRIWMFWNDNYFTKEESDAIAFYIDHILGGLKKYRESLKQNITMQLGGEAHKYLFDRLINSYHLNFSDEDMIRINSAQNIWIYGAGEIGKETAIFLEKNGISIRGFVVTKTDCKKSIYGWNICELSNNDISRNDLIIIAVVPKTVTELIQNLKKHNFDNYVCATKEEDYIAGYYKIVK